MLLFFNCFSNLQVYAISTSSCSSHQQNAVTIPEEDKRHHSNSPIAAFIPKPRAGLLLFGSAYLCLVFFFFSQMRVILLKFPGKDTGILVAKILMRNVAEASECISNYLGHSAASQEHQSAAWCAQGL